MRMYKISLFLKPCNSRDYFIFTKGLKLLIPIIRRYIHTCVHTTNVQFISCMFQILLRMHASVFFKLPYEMTFALVSD